MLYILYTIFYGFKKEGGFGGDMNLKAIESIAISIRTLTMDSIEKARSGHPGMPMGCAEFGALLFGEILNHFPDDPRWKNRDRFILSAGHASMLLYSLLYLSGYDISLEDIKNFRQLGSKTPGHPEYGVTPGVESTTGPLGQGIANAVGMAIAEKMLSAHFNTDQHKIINHYIYVLASDGDMMEGVTYEATSLAGHLGLDNLIVFYDSNKITIDGSTSLCFTENIVKRFESFNWHTCSVNAYDLKHIVKAVNEAKTIQKKPSLIILESVIGKGAPNLSGKHEAHSSSLGKIEISEAKKNMGVPEDSFFYVHPEVFSYFEEKRKIWGKHYRGWNSKFKEWAKENPRLYKEWENIFKGPNLTGIELPTFKIGENISTKEASGEILNAIAKKVPNLIGGSADLRNASAVILKGLKDFQKDNPLGRNINFGVREHAMGAITNGIALYGGFKPFCSTLFVFSDYMRPPIRLASMMRLPVIYIFTHDSIFVGEDGPTHQPVEHLASLRVIPGLIVLRPADAQETESAWKIAIERKDGPVALVLTRQEIEVFEKDDTQWEETIKGGAYIASNSVGDTKIVIIATGSEVNLAIKAKKILKEESIRIVSMISRELFQAQLEKFKKDLIPDTAKTLVIEAGVANGWEMFKCPGSSVISVERFGASGPGEKVAEQCGININKIVEEIEKIKSDMNM